MAQAPRELIRNDVVLKSVRRANVAADYWISGMTLTSFFLFLPFFCIQIQSHVTRIPWPSVVYCRMVAPLTMRLVLPTAIPTHEQTQKKKNLKTFNKPP